MTIVIVDALPCAPACTGTILSFLLDSTLNTHQETKQINKAKTGGRCLDLHLMYEKAKHRKATQTPKHSGQPLPPTCQNGLAEL